MPVPEGDTYRSMAEGSNRRSQTRRKPMLERVNATRHIHYDSPREQEVDPDSLKEEDMMLYGAQDAEIFLQLCRRIGQLSITADDWENRKIRTGSPYSPLSSSPASPARPSPDASRRGFEVSPDRLPTPPAAANSRDGSFPYRRADQSLEPSIPSTSYQTQGRAPYHRRSHEFNPTWMTEGKPLDSPKSKDFGLDSPSRDGSAGTATSKTKSWLTETLPETRASFSSPRQSGTSHTTSRGISQQSIVSAPKALISQPRNNAFSTVKDIILSPPRRPDSSSWSFSTKPGTNVVSRNLDQPTIVSSTFPGRGSLLEGEKKQGHHQSASLHTFPRVSVKPDQSFKIHSGLDATGSVDQSGNESGNTEELVNASVSIEGEDGVIRGPDLAPGISGESWRKLDFLGRGSFGTVYEGVSSEGMYFAVKEVPLNAESKASVSQLEQEIALLSHFQHENIVQYLGTQRTNDALYIFLELVTKGSLVSIYRKYNLFVGQIQSYTRQILHGLKYLHDQDIVHRDIKCANILVDIHSKVKLADFGMAKQIKKLEELTSCKGSAHWMAPEVIDPRKQYHLPADIWSLGCTVLEMATGAPPFGDVEWPRVLWKVAHGEAPPIPEYLNEEMKDFIGKCLEVNPSNRPTAAELLQHPFVNHQLSIPPSPSSSIRET